MFPQVKASLEEGKDVRLGDWKAADVEILNTFQLLTAKPVVYLVSFVFLIIGLSVIFKLIFQVVYSLLYLYCALPSI